MADVESSTDFGGVDEDELCLRSIEAVLRATADRVLSANIE